jgi:hypothetical protein
MTNMEIIMSRAGIVALSFVAALAVSSGALAQGGGAGGGGGAGSAAGGASGAAGSTGNASGARSGPSGASAAQPSGRVGQSGPTGNSAAQPPAAPARTASIPQGRELGRGALPTLQAERPALPDSDKRSARATPTFHGRALAQVTRSVSAGALPLFQCGLTCRVGSARQSHGQSHQWPIGRKNHSSTPN